MRVMIPISTWQGTVVENAAAVPVLRIIVTPVLCTI